VRWSLQTILAHLKQRAPPHAVRRQTPGQVPQNDLFAAFGWLILRQRVSPYANRKRRRLIVHQYVSR